MIQKFILKSITKFLWRLILGNEEKGIRRLTINNCDLLIKIPMKGKIQSLNVSVSAGIIFV